MVIKLNLRILLIRLDFNMYMLWNSKAGFQVLIFLIIL